MRDRTLSDLMGFDHVIQVHPDGTITEPRGIYGPDFLEGTSDGTRETVPAPWRLMTDGYTGQYAYNGPIMHNSESLAGRLESDIRETPGYYVALVCYWPDPDNPDEETDGPYAEGWAVAYAPPDAF